MIFISIDASLGAAFRDAGYNPEGYTLFSYAAVTAWADAANKAKSTDAAAVAKTLRGDTYDSAVGVLAFDQKGDIKNPVYDFYVWKNGKSSPINKVDVCKSNDCHQYTQCPKDCPK